MIASKLKSIAKWLIPVFLISFSCNLLAQDTCSFHIDAGPDINLDLGESAQLNLITSNPMSVIETISWTPSIGLSCIDCYNPIASAMEDICYIVLVTDTTGCTLSDTICIVVQPTAVHNLDMTQKIELFPNPTTDILNLVTNDHLLTEFMIFDALGRPVRVISEPNLQIIHVSDLVPGIYYLQAKLGKHFATKKFVKF